MNYSYILLYYIEFYIYQEMKFIKHRNTWCWGTSTIIITNDGCGTVTVQFDDEFPCAANITGLSVYKDKRNKGYGTALLKEAEKEAKEHNKEIIYISCDKDSWIENWYKRTGYEDDGLIPEFDYKVRRLKKEISIL